MVQKIRDFAETAFGEASTHPAVKTILDEIAPRAQARFDVPHEASDVLRTENQSL